jgi:L-iditol 2-dehydrogenase
VAVAVHAARLTPVAEGDDVVVVGTGLIGLLVIQALRQTECGRILAIDVDDGRLALARRFGAAVTFNPREGDAVERVLEETRGQGAAVALEVVGTTQTIDTAVRSVRRAGAVTLVGNVSPSAEIPLQMVVNRELTLSGSCASNGEYPECIALLARGDIDVTPLISARVSLADAPHWFERLYAREPGLMKVVVTP